MTKKYNAEKLITHSRYQDYFPQLSHSNQLQVIQRVNTLIKENDIYCDSGNYDHLSNIFTAIVLYELLEREYGKDESFDIVSNQMWQYVQKKSKSFKRLSKLPYFLKIIGLLLPYMFAKGRGYGWKYTWHNDKSTNNYLQFECNSCIYQQIFSKYNVEELGPIFCHADDINYGNLQGISFIRHHTLCVDGKDCDFLFVRK